MTRQVVHRYLDPVDEIWLATAQALGLRVQRSDDAYASYDGEGTLTITTQRALRRRRFAWRRSSSTSSATR